MSLTPFDEKPPDRERPTGFVRLAHARARRALKAIAEGRLQDAEVNIDAIGVDCPIDRVCKSLLAGMAAAKRGDFAAAEPHLMAAATAAPVAGLENQAEPDAAAFRLAARALQELGLVYRRQDRPERAYRAHLSAYHVRNEHGSFDEVWESALNLGIDADLAGHNADGQAWHRLAIEAGAKASDQPEAKQARGWTYLSASLVQDEQYQEAVESARTARTCWHRHDRGAVTAAQADMKLGHTLVKLGESLHESDPAGARDALEEALTWLIAAAADLEAFGSDYAADVQWCAEQTDFARRLAESVLDTEP